MDSKPNVALAVSCCLEYADEGTTAAEVRARVQLLKKGEHVVAVTNADRTKLRVTREF